MVQPLLYPSVTICNPNTKFATIDFYPYFYNYYDKL